MNYDFRPKVWERLPKIRLKSRFCIVKTNRLTNINQMGNQVKSKHNLTTINSERQEVEKTRPKKKTIAEVSESIRAEKPSGVEC